MSNKKVLSVALFAALTLALPVQAQQHHSGGPSSSPSRSAGTPRAPELFRGGPRGPMNWGEFHHDTAPSRLAPHRLSGTNFPRPNSWQGDSRRFNLRTWQSGGWRHVMHNGRLGWWWVIGPDWYLFDNPVYPYPDLYTPFGTAIGWWYWCDPYQEYYPFVTYCPVPWESVMPRD